MLKPLIYFILIILSYFLYSCSSAKKDFTYHAVWNKNQLIFEKKLIQLGYLTPYLNVKIYDIDENSVHIKAVTNFDFKFISNNKKYLIECNKKGQVIDTLLTLNNENEIYFTYNLNRNNFYVFIEDGKDRGAYFDDRKFKLQSK